MSETTLKKKRGRKPKNFNSTLIKKNIETIPEEIVLSEDEKIIFHLPITMNEINNMDTTDMSIFINPKKDNNFTKIKDTSDDSDMIDSLKSSSNMVSNNIVNKIQTHLLKFTKNTKCWWCRNTFIGPALQLPEDYYNETFYCLGNFCSFNCMKSYNLDSSDSLTFKRESLIHLLYYMTFSEYKEIIPAPHWITLEEYGGTLSIEKFRESSMITNKEYLVLHPPLISRQMQIEESYKLNKLKEVPIDKVNKIYSEIDSEYTIKRSKPIQTNQLNLETTMGLVKSKKNK